MSTALRRELLAALNDEYGDEDWEELGSLSRIVARIEKVMARKVCVATGCERDANHGRGLCIRCYHRARHDGTLIDYPTASMRSEELVREFLWLKESREMTRRQGAEALGVKLDRLEKAIERTSKKYGVAPKRLLQLGSDLLDPQREGDTP